MIADNAVFSTTPRLKAKKLYRLLKRRVPEGEEVAYLNITPMMDMMTIILVFFLKNFGASIENIPPSILPPMSSASIKPHAALQVQVSSKAILVEGNPVVAVKRGEVDSSVKPDGQSGYLINPLLTMMQKHATRLKKAEKISHGTMPFTGEMVLLADRTIHYRLISEILYTAGQAEFSKYRLLVLKRGD